jgi:hypothetical protein
MKRQSDALEASRMEGKKKEQVASEGIDDFSL